MTLLTDALTGQSRMKNKSVWTALYVSRKGVSGEEWVEQ